MYPSNEAETIELFKSLQDALGWHIVHLQTAFPDAVIGNTRGQRLVVEFEYEAKNFDYHGHDKAGCDLIVCWRDNWKDAPLPVWALDVVKLSLGRVTEALDAFVVGKTERLEQGLARQARVTDNLKDTLNRLPKYVGPVQFGSVGAFYALTRIDAIRLAWLTEIISRSQVFQDEFSRNPGLWDYEIPDREW